MIRHQYHDGTFWLTVGENRKEDIRNRQRGLLDALDGHASGASSSIHEVRDAIAKELEARRVLVIVDDVWAPDAVHAFSIHADGSAVLLTNRRAKDFELLTVSRSRTSSC